MIRYSFTGQVVCNACDDSSEMQVIEPHSKGLKKAIKDNAVIDQGWGEHVTFVLCPDCEKEYQSGKPLTIRHVHDFNTGRTLVRVTVKLVDGKMTMIR